MTTHDLYELKHQIVHMAPVIACAIIKRQNPAADLITRNAAYKEFGRGWVDKHIEPRGMIKGRRFGSSKNSPIKFSRTDFVALLEVERMQREGIIGKSGQEDTSR